jgi:carbamoyl-phosphate synthase small subunit
MEYAVETTKDILETNKPFLEFALGIRFWLKPVGIKTYKMHHGHRGLNHPDQKPTHGKK